MKPCNIFCDHMIFQQKKPILIWGVAERDDTIFAELYNVKRRYKASAVCKSDGSFCIELPPLNASFSVYSLKISGEKDSFEYNNILIGEVWCAAGQSNMQFDACLTKGWEKLISELNNSAVRILTVHDTPDEKGFVSREYEPQTELRRFNWTVADNPEKVANISAVALHFAIELSKKIKLPVGIIGVAVGGSTIDSWFSRQELEADEYIISHLKKQGRYMDKTNHNSFGNMNFTQMTGIYNERIAPILNYNYRGFLWYQGESNIGSFEDANYYEYILMKMFRFYRDIFKDNKMPFICSHLVSHNYATADRYALCYINEAIDYACRHDGNAYQVCVNDIPYDYVGKEAYFWHPIHPTIKEPIGKRMAGLALYRGYSKGKAYGFSGFKSCEFKKDRAIVEFDDTFGGLKLKNDGDVIGFTVAGDDDVYHEAVGKIIGCNTVSVKCGYVKALKNLCYGFYNFNDSCNLLNGLGLPVIPFRTTREDASGKGYYDIQKWASCDYRSVFENNSDPGFGVALYKRTWCKGTIFGEPNVKITYDKYQKTQGSSSVCVRYKPSGNHRNFIGVSPVIDYSGYKHCLDNFRYLTFDLKNPNNREVLFWGLHMKLNSNETYKVTIKDFDSYANYTIKPSEEFMTYTIDLENAINAHGDKTELFPQLRKTAHKLQFTFIDNQNGSLYIDNIRLHN